MLRRVSIVVTAALGGCLVPAVAAHAVVTPPTVSASNVLPVVQGTTAPVGNVIVAEAVPGQLIVGDVITVQLKDGAAGATLHLPTTPVVSGTHGLEGTITVASSASTLLDEAKVTITQASSGSFAGVLTVAQLVPQIDPGASTSGNASAFVSDTAATITPGTSVAVAKVITVGTPKATFAPIAQPTLQGTGSNQSAGQVTIDEPAKDFFATGDVITFLVRDVNGSADTIGMAATPSASGGSMSVSVQGLTGASVQPNEGGFKVHVDAQDPSNGSASTLTISNLVLNTALAPPGPITISAVVTTGSATEYIAPGRVSNGTIGGGTSTTSAGTPVITVPATQQPAANVTVTVAAGALQPGNTFSLAIQEPGVTYNASAPPVVSLTSGNLSLTSATGALDGTNTTATWTVQGPNSQPTTVVIGPIYYDVSNAAIAGDGITVKASGQGSFISQSVTNALLVAAGSLGGTFTAATTPSLSTSSSSPVVLPGVNAAFRETSAGSLPTGSAIILLSPYANQISAYRATFDTVPNVAVTSGNITLGAPTVNSSTITVVTSGGSISAPPQTVVIVPVTAASTGTPSTVTFSSISWQLGNFVPPGSLVATGTANSGSVTGGGTPVAGSQFVDTINGNALGNSAAADTTPPDTFIDGSNVPCNGCTLFNSSSVTFAFHSNEDPFATFTCTLTGQTVDGFSSKTIENNCGQIISGGEHSKTYPSLANGSYTFDVLATDTAGNADTTVTSSAPDDTGISEWSFTLGFDATPPTATIAPPKTNMAGPVVVTFSEQVHSITPADVTLTAASGPAPSVTLTCKDVASATTDCVSGQVKTLLVMPTTPLIPGQTYTVTLNPSSVSLPAPITDLAGNELATTTKVFRASLAQEESSAAAKYVWRTVSTSSASGGSYVLAHKAGATSSYTFTGTGVTWYTETGPTMGKADVLVDGVKKLAVDNYASSTHFGVARAVSGLSSGAHTVRVVVKGTKSASSTGTFIVVDRFLVGATTVQQNATGVTYAWGSVVTSKASGGRYAVDDLAGATVTFTFHSTSVTWVTVTGPGMGKASVYVDGVKKATVDNYSSSLKYGVKRTYGGLTNATHTFKLVLLGTHRSGATGSAVAVDRWTLV